MLLMKTIDQFKRYLAAIDRSNETVVGYYRALIQFNNYIERQYNSPQYIEDITANDIEGYLGYMKSKGNSACSRARSLYILRSFYNYTCKSEITEKNLPALMENIKYQQKERDYLSEEEAKQLIAAIEHEIVKYTITTLFYTGMRISECLNLKLTNVDLNSKVLHVIEGKGKKNRDIPISDKLHEILTEYLKLHRPKINSDFFFATEASGSITSRYVNKILAQAVSKLGWEKSVSAHTLRHSFASTLVKKNVNLVRIQKLLGHSNLKVTSIYTHSNMDELSQTVNLL